MNLSHYTTLVFDCDGVVLNSNRIKTEAFRTAALPYGADAADALVAHHIANGGVSRYSKFSHFFRSILPLYNPSAVVGIDGPGPEELLFIYAQAVRKELMSSSAAEGLEDLRTATRQARWLIVSGGDQQELREIFMARGFTQLFDGGIFGSPDTKDAILAREITCGTIRKPALFLGDSRYDHAASMAADLDFVFVHGWTELDDWQNYVKSTGIQTVRSVKDIMDA